MRRLEPIEVVVDAGVSAGEALSGRTGGQRILELIGSRKITAVVALKLDRLFRDCRDCLGVTRDWDRSGVSLHLVDLGGQAIETSSAMGRFFLTVMAGAAELERNLVRERTSAAMRYKQAKGEYIGGRVPYGYQLLDGELIAEAKEQAVMAIARELRARGLSLRSTARELDRRGIRARNGKIFAAQQIANMTGGAGHGGENSAGGIPLSHGPGR